MTREQLEHAIRAACTISNDSELIVFGSQAILGQFPNPVESLTRSIEVDIMPKNKPEMADMIDGALGEKSLFHQTHGFYVHGVSLESAVLPAEWETRTSAVKDYMNEKNIGWCIEAHDLAASKLIAFRDKDRDFVRRLLMEKMISIDVLIERLRSIENHQELKERAINWSQRIAHEL